MNWPSFQFLQRVAEVDGHPLSYVDEGTGEPVILLHGFPTWGYLWGELMAALSVANRVVVPDFLGYGTSDLADRFDRSIARQTEAIVGLLGALGVESASFVGHDIGGGVALRMAALHPERVRRLCLIDPVSYDSWPVDEAAELGRPGAIRQMGAGQLVSALKRMIKQGMSRKPSSSLLDGLTAPYATEAGKRSLMRAASSLNPNHTLEIVHLHSRIGVPALILWGQDDTFQPVRYGDRLANDLPSARLIRLRGAGHFAMLDQPEETRELIQEFLRPPGGRERAAA